MNSPSGNTARRALTEVSLDDELVDGNLLRRALRNDPAFRKNEHMLRETHHCLHDVFRHQNCRVAGGELSNYRHHVANF